MTEFTQEELQKEQKNGLNNIFEMLEAVQKVEEN